MKEIKSTSNFLSKEHHQIIKSMFLNSSFPWFFESFKVVPNDGGFQFTHSFVDEHVVNSRFYDKLQPLINKLKPRSIRRIKANLTFKTSKIKKSLFHKDFMENAEKLKNMRTAIYYVNTNNGETIFKNGEKEKSTENKMVIFSTNLEHAGTTHTDSLTRILINFNYYV